jgi:hypothetical protein
MIRAYEPVVDLSLRLIPFLWSRLIDQQESLTIGENDEQQFL